MYVSEFVSKKAKTTEKDQMFEIQAFKKLWGDISSCEETSLEHYSWVLKGIAHMKCHNSLIVESFQTFMLLFLPQDTKRDV